MSELTPKGFAAIPRTATDPQNTDLLGIQQGEELLDMKKISYEDLKKPIVGETWDGTTLKEVNDHAGTLQDQVDALSVGGPRGVYDTLVDLQTADPDHSFTYVVEADGNWYFWDTTTSDWLSGGVYNDSTAFNDLAGAGRITETVKGNADEIAGHETRLSTAEGDINSLESDITTLEADDTTEGSVAKSVKDAVDPIDTRVSRLETQSLQIFGLEWDNDTDTYTRTDMAVGLNFGTPDGVNAIASDFDNYYPWKGIRQVKVDSNKNILAELGDSNYSSVDGEYMTLIPQFWFQDYIDVDNVRHIRIATQPVVGFYPAWLDKDGNPVEYRLVGRVPAGYDTELRSKPDMGVEVNRTYTSFITTAYAKGDGGWWLDDSATHHKLGLLMAVEAGDWDQKAKFGQGINSGMPYGSGSEFVCSVSQTGATSVIIPNAGATNMYVGMVMQIGTAYSNNSVAANRKITSITDYNASNKRITVDGAAFDSTAGTTSIVSWGQPVPSSQIDALGGGSGYILQFGSEARSHVSYRGMWDLWGNVWSFTYGFARYNGAYYVCFDQSKYNVSDPRSDAGWIYTGDGEYFDGNGYQLTRKPFVTDQGSVDYVIVIGGGAGSGTFYAAYVYNFTATYDGVRILLSGGDWSKGVIVSLFCCHGYHAPGNSVHSVGSRLIG